MHITSAEACEPRHFIGFCPHCGSHEFKTRSAREFICGACGFNFFINSAAAVAAIVVDPAGRVLLTRRARNPWKGALDLPGGFADPGESAEEALSRELKEELGLEIDVKSDSLSGACRYLCSYANEYIFSGYKVFTTDMAFVVHTTQTQFSASDDVDDYVWLRPQDIDLDAVPATSIRKILEHYIQACS